MSNKDTIIADLRKLVEEQAEQLATQSELIAALTEELERVKVQLAKSNAWA